MEAPYHELSNVAEVNDTDTLTIPRARALVDAVRHQRDYTLIQLLRHPAESSPTIECLIVDVRCDGVPSRNPAGIRYRERLALCVPHDSTELVNVLALRQDFPVLMHQNQGVLGVPANLCLYFEPTASVMRTWTPIGFLRRIQWWLEKSARGELHPVDQPVENLFFASKYEIILPWNLPELRKTPEVRFAIVQGIERPDHGFTCFLEVSQNEKNTKTIAHVELNLPAIVHGFVERDPATLGELADLLARRGVSLIDPLRAALQERVGDQGVTVIGDDKGTIILLQIPIRRTVDAEPDRISHRAFLAPISALALGVVTGALVIHNQRYYKDLMNKEPATAWRDQMILPMQVLTQNDAAMARRQSGITNEGPAGVLVGAGSLGSALLNLWSRSGWGRWTVIDNDHIKPHNLSRHTAHAEHIGQPKAEAVANLHAAAMDGAIEIASLVADATDFSEISTGRALIGATLIVDASATLEYPRAASIADTLPRHVSVFVTPSGNAAVLLAEDVKRAKSLRTLEAQYYRAVIQSEWGKIHLSGNVSTFWSGASCRDISMVVPYSRILNQASTLAEQVQIATAQDEALIRVWQRDPIRGAIEVYDIPSLREQRYVFQELDLSIDDGVEHQLRELRRQAFPNETGGVLIGYYDFNIKAVVIVAGLPAPPDSKSNTASFKRGIVGLAEAVREAKVRTAGVVGYVGEWHSHPPGHSAAPSTDDLIQLSHLALGMADEGLPAVQLIVGENDLQVLQSVML